MVDPYYRNPDMSDAQFVWCQEYISKYEAHARFPDKAAEISANGWNSTALWFFYFLPENYNMARNDLMVLSYVWYKWKKKKKRLYSKKLNQFFDFAGGDGQLEQILYHIDDMEEVTVEQPCWKLAVVLNEQLMFQGENPLGDFWCPFISVDSGTMNHILIIMICAADHSLKNNERPLNSYSIIRLSPTMTLQRLRLTQDGRERLVLLLMKIILKRQVKVGM